MIQLFRTQKRIGVFFLLTLAKRGKQIETFNQVLFYYYFPLIPLRFAYFPFSLLLFFFLQSSEINLIVNFWFQQGFNQLFSILKRSQPTRKYSLHHPKTNFNFFMAMYISINFITNFVADQFQVISKQVVVLKTRGFVNLLEVIKMSSFQKKNFFLLNSPAQKTKRIRQVGRLLAA